LRIGAELDSVPVTGENWSGRRGSNPQPTAWEAATLPLSYSRMASFVIQD
jgi:hypothetical protein